MSGRGLGEASGSGFGTYGDSLMDQSVTRTDAQDHAAGVTLAEIALARYGEGDDARTALADVLHALEIGVERDG